MIKVFIHGLGQNASSWERTNEERRRQDKVLCPELTELLKGKKINYENLYKGFSEYCDSISEPLDLCGLSLGGILALNYAVNHPERVHSLALIAAQYKMPNLLLKFQNAMFRFMSDSMFRQMGFRKKEFIELSRSMMTLDFTGELKKIKCPVFVLCGEKDTANKKASVWLSKCLKQAEFQLIEDAGMK